MASVPRVEDITGRKSADAIKADRDWHMARLLVTANNEALNRKAKLSFSEWKRKVERTRSF